MIIGVLLLFFVKLTRPAEIDKSQPFHGAKYEQMNFITYAYHYVVYSFDCIFNVRGPEDFSNPAEYDKFTNSGECDGSIWYVLGYTMSLFVIQYNVNSIMHHRYLRYVQYLYSLMVPITFLAFLTALPILKKSDALTTFTVYDVIGLMIVTSGVFLFNIIREKPQEICIIESEFNTNINSGSSGQQQQS